MALQWFINNLAEIVFMQLIIDLYILYLFSSFLICCFSECRQELGFDYLRDNLAANSGQLVMRWYIS